MGGKVKQRTKGNTKPSSSGRAAELLSRDGSTGFVGFGNAGSPSDGSPLQFVPVNTDPDTAVHVDFHVVMKKLTKRDAVTKLKAVQEFGELCKTSAMDAVMGALPYWPRLYNKLAMDIDYRVREATQHAMNQLATRVGRNLAPHLKSVMGVWMCSQCDTYVPVATAAQQAFNVAFSENKQAEVLGFCKKEVVEYLLDNLMNQTADTLSDPEIVEEKDRLTKFIRVISSSLLALGKFIKTVSEEVNVQMQRYSENLISEKKFWKLGKHKSPQIRAAFFSLVNIYCQKLPGLAQRYSNSACPIVLGSIDESDAIVAGYLWEAVLQIVCTIQDCWQYVNIEKAVLPKFWNFLSNAAYGNASVVMVSLLPFLSKLPDEVVSPSSGFCQRMFGKLSEGLNQPKVQQSPSECKAVVSAFMDCSKYVVMPRTKKWNVQISEEELQQLRTDIVDQLITVIDLSFSPKSLISSTSLYERLGEFLRVTAEIDCVKGHFWNVFDDLIDRKLRCNDKENQTTFQSIVQCLCWLKSPGAASQKSRSSAKVRFKEANNVNEVNKLEDKVDYRKEMTDIDVNGPYGGKLLNTVIKTSRLCLENVLKERSESHLMVLTQLVKEFCSVALLKDLNTVLVSTTQNLDNFDVSDMSEDSQLRKCCIDVLVIPLIKKNDDQSVLKDKWLLSLVQLLFVLMSEVDENDRMSVLDNVFRVNSTSELLYFVVNEIFETDLFRSLSSAQGVEIGKRIVELLRSFLSFYGEETSNLNDQGFIWKILDLCFAQLELLGFFFTNDSLQEIFCIFHNLLTDEHLAVSSLVPVLRIIEKFIQNAEIHSTKFGRRQELLDAVVMDILQLRLHGDHEKSCVLLQCWQSLISAASSHDDWYDSLVQQTTQVIRHHLYSSKSTTFEKFCVFTETSVGMMQNLNKESNKYFLEMLIQLCPTDTEWSNLRSKTSLESFWQITPLLDGELNFNEPLEFSCVDEEKKLTAHHKITFFLARTLREIFPPTNDGVQVDCSLLEDKWKLCLGLELLWMRECLHRTPSLHNGSTRDNHHVKYELYLQPLLDWLAVTDIMSLLLELVNKSLSCGGLWVLTLKWIITTIQERSSSIQLDTFIATCQSGHHQSALQTLQSLISKDTSIYNLKLIVESHSKEWKDTTVDYSLGRMFCLCLIASAFERWVCLTKDSEIGSLECRSTLLDTLEDIRIQKQTMENLLLFSCSLDQIQMVVVSLNMALIRIFRVAVMHYPVDITAEQWDMILCNMLEWLQSCNESNLALIHVAAFTNHVCQLIETVAKVFTNDDISSEEPAVSDKSSDQTDLDISSTDLAERPLTEKLGGEWREFFSNSACDNLLRLFSKIAGTDISNDSRLFVSFHHLSESLSDACAYLTVDNLKEFTTSKSKIVASAGSSDLAEWGEDVLGEFSPYLESTFSAFQIASYRLLLKVTPEVASHGQTEKQTSDKEDDPSRSPPNEIMSVIDNGQSKLHDVLSEAEVSFGETLEMADDVEALHISRSFLLAWKLLLAYFVNSSEELRVQYANYLCREKYLNEFLEILFRILPRKPGDGKGIIEGLRRLEEKCLLNEEFVHRLAFEAYYDLLRTLPALVRQWWNNLDKKKAAIVEKYTTVNVSPLLCEKEMQSVQRTSTSYENMEIVTRSSTREVIAYYKIEDISIELIVSLSSSHPLGLITVNSGKRVGVKINQWRLWMMQLTTFLMNQNGTIREGLMLWKRNVDKKFEGVDDCMICFSVIHGSNYSLPKLSCRTCKKKFHSACLYRWFSTSNNSTCPLCRNLF